MKSTYIYLSIIALFSIISIDFSSSQSRRENVSRAIIDLRDFEDRSWSMAGFSLDKEMGLRIKAVGAAIKDNWNGKAWILNADNRVVVWEMDYDNTKRGMGRYERVFDDVVTFPRGDYEVYYGASSFNKLEIKNLGELMDGFFSGFKKGRESRKWGISIEPEKSRDIENLQSFKPGADEDAIVEISRVGDNENMKKGFSIDKSIDVRIYAIGEGDPKSHEMFDYALIMNDETREIVWEMDARATDHAGGAQKNRIFDDIISLAEGNYVVQYISDDSHSYQDFNMMPPYDIIHYGITISPAPGSEFNGAVKEYNPSESRKNIIVELTRVGENQTLKKGFELLKRTKIRIYAIGEYSGSGTNLCDYGWIQNARTREIVWQMTKQNTRHAGGGAKNRMVDTYLELPGGAYFVYYQTDIGHSYRKWNTSPPHDSEYYGITLWSMDDDFNENYVRSYSENEDESILAQLVGVRNDERQVAQFRLKKDATIRIYAIGEGDRHEMFDYGWIVDEDGHKVWEMDYNDTEHAGGARKNRVFNDTIELERGVYKVYYQTDDSHSYQSWNASPPDDPYNWGITLTLEDD